MTIYTGPFPATVSGTIDGILVDNNSFIGDLALADGSTITSSGIRIVDSHVGGGIVLADGPFTSISGGISIDAGSSLGTSASTGWSIFLEEPHFSGGIYNAGLISGIDLDNVSSTLTFSGTITNTGTIFSGPMGNAIDLFLAGVHVYDSGTISGNIDAIQFQNGTALNVLTLAPGYSITGKVVGDGKDALLLGGSGSSTFDLTKIGLGLQYQYVGFAIFNVVSGSWTLTGAGNEGWGLGAGTLELASGASITGLTFASSGGTLQLDTGRNQVSGTISGAGIGDAIDLHYEQYVAGMQATWSQSTTTTGTLLLTSNNGNTLLTSLTLTGNYAAGEFQAVSDSNGDTLVNLVAPPKPTLVIHTGIEAKGFTSTQLVSVNDPGNVGYQKLELWDSSITTATGFFTVNGVAQGGNQEIDVAPGASVAHVSSTIGGNDQLWARLLQNDGTLTAWQTFSAIVPLPSLSVQNDATATPGQTIALSSLVTVSDPTGVGYKKLELWDNDGTTAGGYFTVNGQIQTGGHEIDVPSGATVVFHAGTGGTDQLWAQVLQNDNTTTGWQQFSVTTPTPTLTVQSLTNQLGGVTVPLSQLVTINDPSNVGYQELELWDATQNQNNGGFFIDDNSTIEPGNQEIDILRSDVGNVLYITKVPVGTDTLWAQLKLNDGTTTGWQEFTVTVPEPSLTVHVTGAVKSATLALSSLVTINDPADVGYTKLELWDNNGTAAGGQFFINGQAQTGNHEIDVPSGATVTFKAGTGAGTDTLWAQLLEKDGTTTGWQEFTVTTPAPTLVLHTGIEPKAFTSTQLVSVSDPGNVGYQMLELWDSSTTTAGGYFTVNGQQQAGNQEIDVLPGATVAHVSSTIGGKEQLWARLVLNGGTLLTAAWQPFAAVVLQPSLSVQNDATAAAGASIALSSLVTTSDPLSVGYKTMELWDNNGTAAGGQFFVNGVAQTGNHEIDVALADVGNTVFVPGTAAGSDILWAQVLQNDGTLTGWQQFTVTTSVPTLNVSNYTVATASQQISLDDLVTVSDPGNENYQKLELWDDNGTAATGQFIVNGVAQTGNHEIDVSFQNAANSEFKVGSTGASDILYARLLQNDGTLTAWQEFTVTGNTVAAGGTQELVFPSASPMTFAGSSGTLQLDNSASFTGTVSGMTGQDTIDFRDINFATIQTPTLQGATSTGGTLHVTDGTHTANIALLGNYLSSTFVASSDGHGGTNVIDPPASQTGVLTQPAHA